MFVRRKKNRSGSISVQIVKKSFGKSVLVETIGSTKDLSLVEDLVNKASQRIQELNPQQKISFAKNEKDYVIHNYFENESNLSIRTVGPDLVLGELFDLIGFNTLKEDLFKDLVIARLVYPVSKLKTTEYLKSYKGKQLDVVSIYRFLDKYQSDFKDLIEKVAYQYTQRILGKVAVVFYDMTTLYFEAEQEDDLRRIGYSKDGKFQHPQIMLGLLVGENGYPIGYDIFAGNTFEGNTLIPVIKKIQDKYGFEKPVIIADSGLLSKNNVNSLIEQGYQFILGARIKNESENIKNQIIQKSSGLADSENFVIEKENSLKLIISFSEKRANKDAFNRKRGIARLEKLIKTNKLTKQQINNRGYNKFLTLTGKIDVEIDNSKIEEDSAWDGLKGYLTNSNLKPQQIIQNYQQLWQIEKAFRITKSDLSVRPIFHRKKERIEAHISIAFVAYTIYKELDRLLKKYQAGFSVEKAIALCKTIYQLKYKLPESKKILTKIIDLTSQQKLLLEIIKKR